MNKLYVVLYVFLLTLCSSMVLGATFDLDYPVFMDVNETESITLVTDEIITNQTAWILIEGNLINMTKTSNFSWGVSISNTEESDTTFILQVLDDEVEVINSSDGSRESSLTITNQTIYGFVNHSNKNITDVVLENNEVCVNVRKRTGSPSVRGVIGHRNGSGGDIDFHYSTARVISSALWSYQCFSVDYSYDKLFYNLSEFFGIECVNCNGGDQIDIGVDTTGTANGLSVNLFNSTNYTTNSIDNYMFEVIEWEGEQLYSVQDSFYFRTPYYITFQFYQGLNTTTKQQGTYESLFDYVYLYESNGATNSLDYLNGVIEVFAMMPLAEDLYEDTDYSYDSSVDTFYWKQYSGGSAIIKLYNLSTYQVNIMGSNVMTTASSFGEFSKPNPSNDKWQSQIVELDFYEYFSGEKRDATFNIYLKPWEANKSQFMLDLIKWIGMIALLVIIVGVEIGLGADGKVVGYTILAYMTIMGGIGWAI